MQKENHFSCVKVLTHFPKNMADYVYCCVKQGWDYKAACLFFMHWRKMVQDILGDILIQCIAVDADCCKCNLLVDSYQSVGYDCKVFHVLLLISSSILYNFRIWDYNCCLDCSEV